MLQRYWLIIQGAQIGCCFAFTWHWVISLWGWLGRWFLKGRISLLALVLRMPVMQKGSLQNPLCSHAALPCTKPVSHQPLRFLQSFPFGGCSAMFWHRSALARFLQPSVLPVPGSSVFWMLLHTAEQPPAPQITHVPPTPISVPYILYIPASDHWADATQVASEAHLLSVGVLMREFPDVV